MQDFMDLELRTILNVIQGKNSGFSLTGKAKLVVQMLYSMRARQQIWLQAKDESEGRLTTKIK